MNLIFFIELLLLIFVNPKSILKTWQICNISFIISSFCNFYLNYYQIESNKNFETLKNLMVCTQICRILFVAKYIKLMRKFLKTTSKIITKCTHIIKFFFIILFFFGVIGNIVFIKNKIYY